MFGHSFFGASYYGPSYFGPASGSAPPVVTVTPTPDRRRGAMYPGGWIPDRLYTPPRKKLKKRALAQLKRLYEEAREVIPEPLQVGLVPESISLRARATLSLPPASEIDFDALSRSLETIRVLIAAIQEQRTKRRREEETFLTILAELL